MDEQNQNSSTNVILVISAALIVIVAGGWFLLDGDAGDSSEVTNRPVNPAPPPAPVADSAVDESSGAEPAMAAASVAAPEPLQPTAAVAADEPTSISAQVESDLRKARLAAEADILSDPPDQSALHYYARVLDTDPNHEVAAAELNEVLARLNMTATGYLAEEDYESALGLANQVSAVRPDHALVNEVQQTLDRISGEFVTNAMQRAEAGDASGANEQIALAEALPGRNGEYFRAVRESIDDLLEEKAEAKAELEESARASAARETAAWMEKVRAAITAGRLISPENESAMDFIKERDADDEIAGQLRKELLSAILADASRGISAGNFDSANTLLEAAAEVEPESADIRDLKAALDDAYIARESARVLPVTELKSIRKVPAEYPRRAEERGISGWVELVFTVSPLGTTEDVTVAGAEPQNIFNKTALAAVEQWTFEPREFRGQAIAQRATVRLVFQLNQ